MMNRTIDCVRGLHPGRGTALRRLRLLAPLLLLLGIIAFSALTNLFAQPVPSQEKKPAELPNSDRGKEKLSEDKAAPAPPLRDPFLSQQPQTLLPAAASPSFQVTIDPKTPLRDLLPTPPKSLRVADPAFGNDLSRVPEVQFEAPSDVVNMEAMKHIAHQIAKINHLNNKQTDGFIEALRDERTDLIGLPFAMGDACRTKGERSKQFALAVATVRQALQSPVPVSGPGAAPGMGSGPGPATEAGAGRGGSGFQPGFAQPPNSRPAVLADSISVNPPPPEMFWEQYQTLCTQQDKPRAQARREQRETASLARIAALTQILMPMAEMHPGWAKYLSTISHVEATRALARLAIFSSEEDARKAAIDALSVRRERDYTEILPQGLRYPWPTVARRAAEAIAKLERRDLLPQLIGLLEEDDPRSPVMRKVKGKEKPVVRELVRVNHHRSCLLCHAPGNTGKVSADAVTAGVPVPGQPLNPPSGGYNNSQPDIMVRVDVTYLRQDFSSLQAVADANPWPEMQRFDFLVRTRVLSDEEATVYRETLKRREPGEFSPYQRAALAALREMTGRDTEPTPAAWRRLLKMPAD